MPPPPKKPSPPGKSQTPAGFGNPPISAIFYSESGGGKTSLAARFPRCGFICDSQERGVQILASRKLIPPPKFIEYVDANSWKSWEKLLIRIVQAKGDDIDTLVVESMTGIENICFLYHGKHKFCTPQHPEGDFTKEGFYNRWQGPKNAARFDWPDLMEALNEVLESGKNVIVTAHAQSKEVPDPMGVSVLKYAPYSEKDTWTRLHRWASLVGFLAQRIREDRQNKSLKKIAAPDFDRLLYVSPTPFCEAKNWYGMQGPLPQFDSPDKAYGELASQLGL